MNADGQDPAGGVAVRQADFQTEVIGCGCFEECQELTIPGEAFGIAIGARNDRNKNEAL